MIIHNKHSSCIISWSSLYIKMLESHIAQKIICILRFTDFNSNIIIKILQKMLLFHDLIRHDKHQISSFIFCTNWFHWCNQFMIIRIWNIDLLLCTIEHNLICQKINLKACFIKIMKITRLYVILSVISLKFCEMTLNIFMFLSCFMLSRQWFHMMSMNFVMLYCYRYDAAMASS